MKNLLRTLRPAVACLLTFTVLCGILYTGAVTGIAQLFFPDKANGSLITVEMGDGSAITVGSALIAQEFTRQEYLIGRPSGPSNLSPVGEKQREIVEERIAWWRTFDPANQSDIPADLVTASGSGADPGISPEAAEFQVARIAKARNMEEEAVRRLIRKYTTGRFLGFWGEASVNVLKVNLALDGLL